MPEATQPIAAALRASRSRRRGSRLRWVSGWPPTARCCSTANQRVNLTGAKDPAALFPHLLDALTLAGDVAESPLVDVGSGGGLPGIPLALATGVERRC